MTSSPSFADEVSSEVNTFSVRHNKGEDSCRPGHVLSSFIFAPPPGLFPDDEEEERCMEVDSDGDADVPRRAEKEGGTKRDMEVWIEHRMSSTVAESGSQVSQRGQGKIEKKMEGERKGKSRKIPIFIQERRKRSCSCII